MKALSLPRSFKLMAGALALAVAGTLSVVGAEAAPGHHGGGHHGMMGGRMIERMLDGVNATDAQRTQIRQIMQSAATDLKAQRESARALREQSMQLFTQPNVDANAAEALRQQMMAQHDQASKTDDAGDGRCEPRAHARAARPARRAHEAAPRHVRAPSPRARVAAASAVVIDRRLRPAPC